MGWSKIVRRAAQRARHQVKQEIDGWLDVAGIEKGPIFRRVLANGRVGKDALTERAVWQLVREYAAQIGIGELAPHDLRRTAAKLCRSKGGELEQIKFLLVLHAGVAQPLNSGFPHCGSVSGT